MKYMYLVEHYVPFPQSEYGGLWSVIAQDDEECFDLITQDDQNYFNEKYYGNLREHIAKAQVFELASNEVKPQIAEAFTT
jgi:hypothetical protein